MSKCAGIGKAQCVGVAGHPAETYRRLCHQAEPLPWVNAEHTFKQEIQIHVSLGFIVRSILENRPFFSNSIEVSVAVCLTCVLMETVQVDFHRWLVFSIYIHMCFCVHACVCVFIRADMRWTTKRNFFISLVDSGILTWNNDFFTVYAWTHSMISLQI